MSDLNDVVISGRLVRDVEVKTLQTGKVLVNASVAVGYSYKSGEEWKNLTDFVDFTAWGNSASRLQGAKKGAPILVKGRLQQEQWEDNGQKRSKLKVRADVVELLVPRPKKTEAAAQESTEASPTNTEDDIPF